MKKLTAGLVASVLGITAMAAPITGYAEESSTDPSEWPVVATEIPSRGNMDDVPMVQDAMNEYLASINAGVQIELVPVEIGNIATTMTLMLTGGDDPIDLFNWRWFSTVGDLVRNDQIIPLDDYKDQYPEMWELTDENVMKSHQINGVTYGFPTMDGFCGTGWYALRRDIAEELGVADREGEQLTLEELTDLMKKAKELHPEFIYSPNSEHVILNNIDNFSDDKCLGVLMNNGIDQKEIVNFYDTQQFEDYCYTMKDWADSGLYADDPMNQQLGLDMYSNGVAAGFVAVSYSVDNLKASTTNLIQKYDYVAFQLGDLTGKGYSIAGGWCVSSVSKNPDAAVKLLDLLETDATLENLISRGIENVHYVLDEKGCAWYPEGLNAENIGYNNVVDWFFPNRYLVYPFENDDPDYYEKMKNVSKDAKWSTGIGFTFDSEPVYDQYTACSAVVDEYLKALNFGQVDVDEYLPQFREELHNAGIDDIVAEMQRQFDEFLNN